VPARASVRHTVVATAPRWSEKVVIPNGGHFRQDGRLVHGVAITKTVAAIEEVRPHLTRDPFFIGHQANLPMLRQICQLSGIAADRHLYNIDRFGNCGTSGAPSVLSEQWERFTSADELLLAQVGAGMTAAIAVIHFA
jgi:3-oxoacyl-[acyl-carrier-protein] synthase III